MQNIIIDSLDNNFEFFPYIRENRYESYNQINFVLSVIDNIKLRFNRFSFTKNDLRDALRFAGSCQEKFAKCPSRLQASTDEDIDRCFIFVKNIIKFGVKDETNRPIAQIKRYRSINDRGVSEKSITDINRFQQLACFDVVDQERSVCTLIFNKDAIVKNWLNRQAFNSYSQLYSTMKSATNQGVVQHPGMQGILSAQKKLCTESLEVMCQQAKNEIVVQETEPIKLPMNWQG